MSTRLQNCKTCLDGASNERRVAMALVEAIDECRAEDIDPHEDPLVFGILHHLAWLLACSDLTENRECADEKFKQAYNLCYPDPT